MMFIIQPSGSSWGLGATEVAREILLIGRQSLTDAPHYRGIGQVYTYFRQRCFAKSLRLFYFKKSTTIKETSYDPKRNVSDEGLSLFRA